MGNKSTTMDVNHVVDYYFLPGKSVQPSISEESYIPMSPNMKKTLVVGKRYRHVTPFSEQIVVMEDLGEEDEAGEGEEGKDVVKAVVFREEENPKNDSLEPKNSINCNHSTRIVPVVTVLSSPKMQERSGVGLDVLPLTGNKSTDENCDEKPGVTKAFPKSPTMTNRRYSLIDMRTGLKKSKFTMELEDKLRVSKLELGFDSDINDWKEFTYRMENPASKKLAESLQKESLKFSQEGYVGKGLEHVRLKDPLEYCAQNCQIMGLCSVRRPELIMAKASTLEASVFKNGVNRDDLDSVLNLKLEKHPRKEECNCDNCMLAFLTEMGFPEKQENRKEEKDEGKKQIVTIKKTRSPGNSRRLGGGGFKEERIRIVENENTQKSIEICFKGDLSSDVSYCNTDNEAESQISTSTFDGDCTNKRIKNLFKKNATKREAFNEHNTNQDKLSIKNVSSTEKELKSAGFLKDRAQEVLQVQTGGCRRSPRLAGRRLRSRGMKHSSNSTLGASNSSSLSSILSYKRVRQMFQTIIERNRTRRRPKKNINKFREMEELGLGEVKNNRWYPSAYKTLSIWNGFHQSVQGIQAEFKKYPKNSLKCIID